jgi:hypothetical protein
MNIVLVVSFVRMLSVFLKESISIKVPSMKYAELIKKAIFAPRHPEGPYPCKDTHLHPISRLVKRRTLVKELEQHD